MLDDGRQKHIELLDHCTEAGETLCAVLSHEGREVIQQQTGALQQELDELLMKLTSSLQQLDVSLMEWTSYTDCMRQVEAWLAKMRTLISDELPLVGTLEEKKAQLQMFKVLQLVYCIVFLDVKTVSSC